MVSNLVKRIRQRLRVLAWYRRARKKHTVRFRIGGVCKFLRTLEDEQIPAVVLRQPESVPRDAVAEAAFGEDVDLLIDGQQLNRAVEIAAAFPGPIKCDPYTNTGHRGTTYRKLPYYPPALADQILADRELYDNAFYVPGPDTRLWSMAYHVAYHKGTESGLPTGCHLETNPHPKRDYQGRLIELAERCGVSWDRGLSLIQLHEELKSRGWDMPSDLMARWPILTDWHRWLHDREIKALDPWARQLPGLLVFLIRDDAVAAGLQDRICNMLAETFQVLDVTPLDTTQVESVTRRVRGGNWIEHRKTTLVAPRIAVTCYDHNPITTATDNTTTRLLAKHPQVTNLNVFQKHAIREQLNLGRRRKPTLHAVHGSDNAHESQHMLQAIHGDSLEQANLRFLELLATRSEAA
ncbi:MAG: hypothetical protein CMJ68_01145 [Planctomycetaceae bacterium]|nr:hypothetical protein [Planctomycetaceae bacterium]|tara:strand:+ start:560 stop:1783 length:1224 start_codon:yes stop_codon:yes gene_type:complete